MRKTSIAEPEPANGYWRWHGDEPAKRPVYANRARLRSRIGRETARRRGELVERSFAHVLDRSGMPRVRLRGRENGHKGEIAAFASIDAGPAPDRKRRLRQRADNAAAAAVMGRPIDYLICCAADRRQGFGATGRGPLEMRRMNILFALPGLHLWDRGAEVAFVSVATALANAGDRVTLIGSGPPREGTPYHYVRAGSLDRSHFNRFPSLPFLRNEYAYEELTFAPSLLSRYRPSAFDVTMTCSYPYTNWILRRPVWRGKRPPHVFVTQNGDWPACHDVAEYRYFGCEGLVCTNPDFYERNRNNWNCALIPNGVDVARFTPGPPQRGAFGLPEDRLIVLMVSAMVDFKRVAAGIEAVSLLPDAHLVVAGDGPLRETVLEKAAELIPGRFTRLSAPASQMPDLYRSANVFLHMAFEESFGNVYVEALACGLPVVGHDSARLRWIVGDAGYLLDTRDAPQVAATIVRAAEASSADRDGRIARAAAFSWKHVGARYGAFLREVAEAARPSRD